ncbi:MAG: LCCL domain-containing protein [Candidatus Limnocylindria bacterium]
MNGQEVDYVCPPGGTPGSSWGTDVYTDDSSVCTAAVHAGAITVEEGGIVTIEIRPGQDAYEASERNGIASRAWGLWGGSFVVVGTAD